MRNIVEYKIYEYLGDALLWFVLGELLLENKNLDKFQKRKRFKQISELCCNNYLSLVAQEMGLEPHPEDKEIMPTPGAENKLYANAYEVMVYETYEARGLEAVKTLVKETLIKRKK